MTIILTGGGSGGHITPVLAVANELKKEYPGNKLIYIGQKGDSLADIPARHKSIDGVFTVRAGKFRRYQGGIIKQLLDLKTLGKNIRDFFYVGVGIIQSVRLMKRLKPDVVFIRGGFVGVPVGLAAAWCRVPYITHDSDALASLANRLIARWAVAHAVAMPKQTYSYPQNKTFQVGVPVDQSFQSVTNSLKTKFRIELNIPEKSSVVLMTGGGLGAQRLNDAILRIAPVLLKNIPGLILLHLTGRKHSEHIAEHYKHILGDTLSEQIRVEGFVEDLYRYSGAADVIVCRAGATNLAEFAIQGKACIVVPNPQLTGGHQVENSRQLEKAGAVLVLDEDKVIDDPTNLLEALQVLLVEDVKKRIALEKALSGFARPTATADISQLIINVANKD